MREVQVTSSAKNMPSEADPDNECIPCIADGTNHVWKFRIAMASPPFHGGVRTGNRHNATGLYWLWMTDANNSPAGVEASNA
jgi:hypothetical protein